MQAPSGGAIYSRWSAYLRVGGGSHFTGSIATASFGGAIYVSDLLQDLTISDATFTGNTCNNTADTAIPRGGAVRGSRKKGNYLGFRPACHRGGTFTRATTALVDAGRPPSILHPQVFVDRGLPGNAHRSNFTASIVNAGFSGNSCANSGAVHVGAVNHMIGPNVTFDGNWAWSPSGFGGALSVQSLVRGEACLGLGV